VVAALNNYYGITISLKASERDRLAMTQVTTTFKNQSLESAIKDLALTTSLRISKLDETKYEISAQ
jgi:hypothetical protein